LLTFSSMLLTSLFGIDFLTLFVYLNSLWGHWPFFFWHYWGLNSGLCTC
jgi:hypothetical protein